MHDFIILQLKLSLQNKNSVPLSVLQKFIGVHITQKEYEEITGQVYEKWV